MILRHRISPIDKRRMAASGRVQPKLEPIDPSPAAGLDLSLSFGDQGVAPHHRVLLTRRRVQRWVAHALQRPAQVAVRVVGEPEARELNARFRGRDYATNVLTFDYCDAVAPVVMADLVLCAPVVEREALQQGKSLHDHYCHLLVHGTLHAQGWDHETGEADALRMEAAEILLLGALGVANPY